MNSHPDTCRCAFHFELQLKRDAAYRRLAQTILGPNAPATSAGLVRALAEHARKLRTLAKAA